jgi:hypothetical protein
MQIGVVVGEGDWQQTLNNNRDVFMKDFVTRAEFVGLYPTTDTPAQYVDKLYQHARVTPTVSERDDAIAEFGSATTAEDTGARGRALLQVTQEGSFQQREINRSFVQMQYIGYLQRNPNDLPDGNFAGFEFWLQKLNSFNGNFIEAEMVKAFINSPSARTGSDREVQAMRGAHPHEWGGSHLPFHTRLPACHSTHIGHLIMGGCVPSMQPGSTKQGFDARAAGVSTV